MPRAHRVTLRRTLSFFSALAVLALTALDAGAILPRRVTVHENLILEDGRVEVRASFREGGVRMLVESDDLQPPTAGSYDLVFASDDDNFLVVNLGGHEGGGFSQFDEEEGDLRLSAIGLNHITLYDGDTLVGEIDLAESSARLFFESALSVERDGKDRPVLVSGRAARRASVGANYEIRIVTGAVGPGDYVVRLSGPDGHFDIPFTIPSDRVHARITIAGAEDKVAFFASMDRARLGKDGIEVDSAPLTIPE